MLAVAYYVNEYSSRLLTVQLQLVPKKLDVFLFQNLTCLLYSKVVRIRSVFKNILSDNRTSCGHLSNCLA